jgi:hypothetical protein
MVIVATNSCRQNVRAQDMLSLSLSFLLPPIWSIGHPWNVLFHFSFLFLTQSVGLPGRGISPSQGRYLYKHIIYTDKHPCLEWDSNPWSQRSSGRRQFIPYTPRGHCDRQSSKITAHNSHCSWRELTAWGFSSDHKISLWMFAIPVVVMHDSPVNKTLP